MSDLKTPPNNSEAERAVLGSILLGATGRNDDRILDLCNSSGLVSDSFYDPRNRTIFAAMREMSFGSQPVDSLTLMEKLRTEGKLEAVGGVGYIQSLVDGTPTTAHAEYYINLVLDKHLRRMMIDRATKTIDKCYDEAGYADPRAVLGDAEKAFLEIGSGGGTTMPWSDAVQQSFLRIDRMFESNGRNLEGLSTGLKYLDEKLQGLKPAEMIVIAARPSVGKTSLAMNIAESVALGRDMNDQMVAYDKGTRHPVLVFSLEMPVEALSKRMIAGRAHVNMWQLNRGQLRAQRQMMANNLAIAADQLKGAPIFVDDTASLDVMDLRARARRMKKQHQIELIVIDYLQLCRCTEYARQGRQIEVSQISQQIKAMAKELRIPVIVLSQLSRANEQRGDKYERPKLSDLRDSGAIEQDADVVFLLRRPSRNPNDPQSGDETLAYIDVAKNRNGETGDVAVNFFREFTRFGDRAPEGTAAARLEDEAPAARQDEFGPDTMM